MSARAPAKVNLALHLQGRRADGYHLLDTLVVFAEAGDHLQAALSESTPAPAGGTEPRSDQGDFGLKRAKIMNLIESNNSERDAGGTAGLRMRKPVPAFPHPALEISGPFAGGLPADGRNLVLHAAEAIFAAVRLGPEVRPALRLHLEKELPVASGIGGGSADAAAALRLINALLGLGLSEARLAEIAAPLGADVPMCVYSRALRARGIGEEITLIDGLPRLNLVLVNPGFSLATAAVFAARDGEAGEGLGEIPRFQDAGGLAAWLSAARNDLEEAACRLAPPVRAALEAIAAEPGCLLARMSGSGATVFGIFGDAAAAHAAASDLARAEPGWWIRATRTL